MCARSTTPSPFSKSAGLDVKMRIWAIAIVKHISMLPHKGFPSVCLLMMANSAVHCLHKSAQTSIVYNDSLSVLRKVISRRFFTEFQFLEDMLDKQNDASMQKRSMM
jgi:hypothetical protein